MSRGPSAYGLKRLSRNATEQTSFPDIRIKK